MLRHPLLERALAEGTPLIEGKTAAFVWRGHRPPKVMGDFNRWNPARALELKPVGPGLWAGALDFPRDTYMEYICLRIDFP
jgi:hypothetical protein